MTSKIPLCDHPGITGRSRLDRSFTPFLSAKGFTLLELAIVLVIVGVMIGLGTGMMGSVTKRMKLNESRQNAKTAKEAMLSYAVRNGYLPSDSDTNPLGKAGTRSRDAYGNTLQYFADDGIEGSDKEVCEESETDFIIYECIDTSCASYDTLENIAFVVFSSGEDKNGSGTNSTAVGSGSPCPSYTVPSCDSGKTCYFVREQGTCYESGGSEYRYDDIVYYASIFEIQRARKCN